MPRQDVPYGGAICRLKERIAEIWDKLDEKLHSINGVEGDGAGNVDIVSGNDAVVIANDQVGHRIEVSLDSSKLPAAGVSSVNGRTGAVRLDAADIPSNGNSNVQADIAWSKTAISDCFDSVTTERDDRQAADAELQANINTVQASIQGKLDQKLHSVNGVEGDGAGNVEIVSGNDAVVIAKDQVGHRIEVSLDSSKLPAAAVSSVNWQTGAVRLDAADIPSDGNSNVQADIAWSKTAISDCFDSITTEQDDRWAADEELQANIDTVQASILGKLDKKTDVSAGGTVLTVDGSADDCYIYKITDTNGRNRGSINHQTYISNDRKTRIILQLQSDNYDTTSGTGATANLMLELLQSGTLQLTLNTTTGDGREASQRLAMLTPS